MTATYYGKIWRTFKRLILEAYAFLADNILVYVSRPS